MLILPAIDIRGGLCVRLTQGDYAQERIYDADPKRVAQQFEDQGATWIHVVDLDGAKGGEPQNWTAIESVVSGVQSNIEFGGGVRSVATAQRLIDMGVARLVVGTALVQDEELASELLSRFGDRIVAGIDARDGQAALVGWTQQTSVTAVSLAQTVEARGAKRIILTDIARDGMLTGPNLDLLDAVSAAVRIPVIQSGGIGTLEHLKSLYDLGERRPEGVIVGRAIYERNFTVREAVQLVAS